ncbi:hypothetical protein OCU04_010255 [Sclerotinia nivalis]|uniref:Uncharacterized protein n=1 Tax=Sclerotinia nivalis TaxID=352851 RepID=A0A9X0AE67_9HELO|nr:hypothetical protein OCU04_010255 [Sclerotinia nivalis]
MARSVPKKLIKERSDRIRLRKKISASLLATRQLVQVYNQHIKDFKQEQRKAEATEDFTDCHYYMELEEIIVEYKKRVEELEDKETRLEKTDMEFAARLEELNTIISRRFTNGSEEQQTEHTRKTTWAIERKEKQAAYNPWMSWITAMVVVCGKAIARGYESQDYAIDMTRYYPSGK